MAGGDRSNVATIGGYSLSNDENSALFDSYSKLGGAATQGDYNTWKANQGFTNAQVNPLIENNNQVGLLGFTNGEWNNASQAAGLAGTAYNLYDNILGNKAQMYKTQMSAMRQNMANIAEDRANHAKFQGNFGGGFNSAFGSGLASTAVRV